MANNDDAPVKRGICGDPCKTDVITYFTNLVPRVCDPREGTCEALG